MNHTRQTHYAGPMVNGVQRCDICNLKLNPKPYSEGWSEGSLIEQSGFGRSYGASRLPNNAAITCDAGERKAMPADPQQRDRGVYGKDSDYHNGRRS